jgi:hypothetical protein
MHFLKQKQFASAPQTVHLLANIGKTQNVDNYFFWEIGKDRHAGDAAVTVILLQNPSGQQLTPIKTQAIIICQSKSSTGLCPLGMSVRYPLLNTRYHPKFYL